ncbi:alpha-glucuronidase family glycosyl hydrolase [Paenibacillus chondroitinus]|uniref:Xylan alpha-1,2-glucuronidase n=1 Tax=Paenibacillus chondroitinus TaxID=59842 RepID=A0ABU6DCP0_9BACL|nr:MULTISPECIES: alpha-glucuronidase family glycosyl hydrolase [Paenibacillus]MCY9659883.1 alpha-glucuronidase [Paenibacillus anseongense]MEB4795499.1 alpha-glucuronidase family glycosyl hydrolase [Paenibacillus chondroitinus]
MSSKGYACWLEYELASRAAKQAAREWGREIVMDESPQQGPLQTAVNELTIGLEAIIGQRPSIVKDSGQHRHIVVGTSRSPLVALMLTENELEGIGAEGYRIKTVHTTNREAIVLAGGSSKGCLYGVFHLLRLLLTGAALDCLDITEQPKYQLRMINHWDNMDGSIERGYAGRSFLFRNNEVLAGSQRIRDYARLMASIGINGIAINNVNVHKYETLLVTEPYLPLVAVVADVFREYGIRLFLSVNYASPLELGETTTADPLDESVAAWWKTTAENVYRYIPDFGGFVVKADSENRPGPFTYGRDHADGANMLAEALKPYGGLVMWRCFVYNCHQDWRDRLTDRARAAYDHFKPLDGRFMDNVVLQIKNGPMDFQVLEPVSPLFGAMERTNQIMEFQITQEYTGHQIDVCYLIPQWKEILEFDTYMKGKGSTIKEIAAGTVHPYVHCGITAVTNVGDDANWTGHHLAQANLYGYGRLIWNPELTAEEIINEWVLLTFGDNPDVAKTITDILMTSWPTYENYTAPLGVGWMVRPHLHYGVDVDGYEYSKWGTYHFADHTGIGVDRTIGTGTGYTGQYGKTNAELYEGLNTCPDKLLLFFHHVPYTHSLQTGKTVIQHIYDTHFAGVEQVEQWIVRWQELEGKMDAERFVHIAGRLDLQLDNAKQWRDVINTYFYRKSGIYDQGQRVIYV